MKIIIYNSIPEDPLKATLKVIHMCNNSTLEETISHAKEIVPSGKLFKLADSSELPRDRTFRNAWEIDDSELTDGIGEA